MKLTIIIPCYNGEEFLSRCMDSILCQDTSECEILLVDDGSTDGTPALCDSYGEKGVRVFHTQNQGAPEARNFAIARAGGEFIWCIDSDDTVEPNAIGVILRALKENQPDCLRFGHKTRKDEKDMVAPSPFRPGVYTGEALQDIQKYTVGWAIDRCYFLWNHVCRAELMRQVPLMPIREYMPEDHCFHQRFYPRLTKLQVIEDALYVHIIRQDSLTYQKYSSLQPALNLYRLLRDDFRSMGVLEQYRLELVFYIMDALYLGRGLKRCGILAVEYCQNPDIDDAHEKVRRLMDEPLFREVLAQACLRRTTPRQGKLYGLLAAKNEPAIYEEIMVGENPEEPKKEEEKPNTAEGTENPQPPN